MIQQIVALFPIKHVKQIIDENLIAKAVASGTSSEMQQLMIMWKNYVEPDLNTVCGTCFERILKNYKELQSFFIDKLKQESLLDVS